MRIRFRHACLFIAIVLGGLWLSRVQAQEVRVRGQEIRPQTGAFAGTEFYANSHALLIGIGHYPNLPRSKDSGFAEKGPSDLRDMLVRHYGFLPENIAILSGEEATKSQITKALAALADSGRVGPNDRVLVYFAGHAQTVSLPNGSKVGYLVPQDAVVDLARPDNPGPFADTCLSMKSVWEALEICPARHRLLLLEARLSGLQAKPDEPEPARPTPAEAKQLLSRPALQVIAAGSEAEAPRESPNLGQRQFTHSLLEMLRTQATTPDNVFTAANAASLLRKAEGDAPASQFANRDTDGEVFFVTTPAKRVAEPAPRPVASGPRNPRDGAELCWVPAGEFLMGASPAEANLAISQLGGVRSELLEEMPMHRVYLDGYWIYKTAVTVAQYRRFCEETGRRMPPAPDWGWQDNHPITNTTLQEAWEYCRWAGARMPTEAEWEKAARGVDGRLFPWGNTWDPTRCANSVNAKRTSTEPVGSYPNGASPYGVLDLAGNESERCADWYGANYYKKSPPRNPTGPARGTVAVVRGGTFGPQQPNAYRVARRHHIHPSNRYPGLGFRCVISP